MRTLLISFVAFTVFISFSSAVFAQKKSLQLDPYYPLTPTPTSTRPETPITPSPTPPPGTTTTSPATPITPTVTLPPQQPLQYCDSLRIAFSLFNIAGTAPLAFGDKTQEINAVRDNPHLYGIVYTRASFLADRNNAAGILAEIKRDPLYPNLQNQLQTPNGKATLYGLLTTILAANQNIRGTPAQVLAGITAENLDDVKFYEGLYKILDHALLEDGFTTGVSGNIMTILSFAVQKLQENNLPKLPFLVVNRLDENIKGFFNRLFEGKYQTADDWHTALNKLRCEGRNVPIIPSASPLIHVYSPSQQKVHISIPKLSYSEPPYSFNNGFEIVANSNGDLFDFQGNRLPKDYLYYEFLHDADVESIVNPPAGGQNPIKIVKKQDLESYLLNTLIPQLGLTSKEQKDFIQKDVTPQLKRLQQSTASHETYHVYILQERELTHILPLHITPQPDTIVRNMIVVKRGERTSELKEEQSFSWNSPKRKGFTVVENGFIVLE